MSNSVLVIGGRDFQIKGLQELNIDFVLFQNRDEITDYQIATIKKIFLFDYLDVELVLEHAKIFHNKYNFKAVIAYREFAQYPCAVISKNLGLLSNCQPCVVEVTRNKLLMRKKLSKNRLLNNVRFSRVEKIVDLEMFFDSGIKSAILKPVDGTGSIGVVQVNKENVREAYEYCRKSSSTELIVEEYIGGDEYSVETISSNGTHDILAVTKKITTGPPYFVEVEHFQPALLEQSINDLIKQSVTNLLNELGYLTGPAHTEIKIYKGVVYVIETHTRNGGDNIWHMTKITTGRDMFKETVSTLLSLEHERERPKAVAAKVKYFNTHLDGFGKSNLLEKAQKVFQGVVDLEVLEHKDGSLLNDSCDRNGYILVAGECEIEIDKNINEISTKILTEVH